MTTETAIIILAAGASSRLGQPKQLLPFKAGTFIEQLASEAVASRLGAVVVVTGAAEKQVQDALKNIPVKISFHPNWREGMGSSIACGMKALMETSPACENVIICVCDQPDVDAAVLNGLAEKRRTSGKGIVASAYAGTVGTPVLFSAAYFGQLVALSGEAGAKTIVKSNGTDLATLPFEAGARDIDTPADYAQLLQTIPQL
jgi:molybdenum cofactor cytidylyltransferase